MLMLLRYSFIGILAMPVADSAEAQTFAGAEDEYEDVIDDSTPNQNAANELDEVAPDGGQENADVESFSLGEGTFDVDEYADDSGNGFLGNPENNVGGLANQGVPQAGQNDQVQTAPVQVNNPPPQQVPVQVNNPPPQQQIPIQQPLQQPAVNANPIGAGLPGDIGDGTELGGDESGADPSEVYPMEEENPVPEALPLPPPNDFAGAPPVPGTMRALADGEGPEEYVVQEGDTLFDVCDQLLDEPTYWPKLWAMNPEIKNPHFIFPGMRVRFYPGDDETPPYLQVVAEEDTIPIDDGDLDEALLVQEDLEYAEAQFEFNSTPVVGPEEVQISQDVYEKFIDVGGRFDGGLSTVRVPGFITTEPRDALGYVLGGGEGQLLGRPGQAIVVEDVGGVDNGTVYSVFRPSISLENPETEEEVGFLHLWVGDVKVYKNAGEGIVLAKMLQGNRDGIRPDDIVTTFVSTKRTVPIGGTSFDLSTAEANVVSIGVPDRRFAALGHFVFLDQGTGNGVSAGMHLPVFSTPGYLDRGFAASNLPLDFSQVGVVRVIDATDSGSVGYVVQATREIRVGDRVGKAVF